MNLDEIRETIKENDYSLWLWFMPLHEAINEKKRFQNIDIVNILIQTKELLMCMLFSNSGKSMYRLFIKGIEVELFQYCYSDYSEGAIFISDFEYKFNLGIKELNLEPNSDLFEIIQNEEIIY